MMPSYDISGSVRSIVEEEVEEEVGNPQADAQTIYDLLANADIDAAALVADSFLGRVKSFFPTTDLDYLSTYKPAIVASDALADTYGAWTETTTDTGASDIGVCWVALYPQEASSHSARNWAVQVGTGAGGAEAAVITLGSGTFELGGTEESKSADIWVLPFPRRIPANSRISARVKDSEAAARSYRVTYGWVVL